MVVCSEHEKRKEKPKSSTSHHIHNLTQNLFFSQSRRGWQGPTVSGLHVMLPRGQGGWGLGFRLLFHVEHPGESWGLFDCLVIALFVCFLFLPGFVTAGFGGVTEGYEGNGECHRGYPAHG
jgi:hypothetical protein